MNIVEEGKNKIKEGIENGITKEVVEFAERFGNHLGKEKLSTSQIRNIYTTVKRMEMKGEYNESELLLLKPKLAYAAKRGKKGAEDFKDVFTVGIDTITEIEDKNKKEEAFKNFCKFFEAVLAYHKAAG